MIFSVHQEGIDEFIEQKSRFIGWAMPVKTEEEALEYIEKIRELHPKATHNCFAYIIGEGKNIQRFSDDGEPSGTAGIPMLEVLKKQDLTDICVVATRYFGGILLGAGGLARAYTKSAVIAIEKALPVEKRMAKVVRVKLSYEFFGSVDYRLKQAEIIEINREYGEDVVLELLVLSKGI